MSYFFWRLFWVTDCLYSTIRAEAWCKHLLCVNFPARGWEHEAENDQSQAIWELLSVERAAKRRLRWTNSGRIVGNVWFTLHEVLLPNTAQLENIAAGFQTREVRHTLTLTVDYQRCVFLLLNTAWDDSSRLLLCANTVCCVRARLGIFLKNFSFWQVLHLQPPDQIPPHRELQPTPPHPLFLTTLWMQTQSVCLLCDLILTSEREVF